MRVKPGQRCKASGECLRRNWLPRVGTNPGSSLPKMTLKEEEKSFLHSRRRSKL
jgi:hypothetical protein